MKNKPCADWLNSYSANRSLTFCFQLLICLITALE
nr:MAG TPA: hypothetical protein [Caudoviricetes sp.]DAK96436.1 MAG TPA: hypothetical protein [Caudoviricetes sp.]